jgi:uncharacterized protein (TIGR02996 family)
VDAEEGFINAILASPADAAPRLVYADWLEERGDEMSLRRAEFLRVECELDGKQPKRPVRTRLVARLRELRAQVGDDWWRALDHSRVEYCLEFEFACPKRWDQLEPTADPGVRHCSKCDRSVFYCRDSREAVRLAEAGECVAIDSRAARLLMHFLMSRNEGGRTLLGKLAPGVPRRIPLTDRGKGS